MFDPHVIKCGIFLKLAAAGGSHDLLMQLWYNGLGVSSVLSKAPLMHLTQAAVDVKK